LYWSDNLLRITHLFLRVLVFTGALQLLGCGYQLIDGQSGIPKDVKTLVVTSFVNRTRTVGLGDDLTSAVKRELRRQAPPNVVDSIDEADAILSGVVRSFRTRAVSVNNFDEVLQYETRMNVEVTLRRREPSEVLWPRQTVQLRQVYEANRGVVVPTSSEFFQGTLNVQDVSQLTDVKLTEDRQAKATEDLVDRFARELRERMAEGF